MTQYLVLLPGDESRWQQATEAERVATYDRHGRFMALLAERGHRLIGGAELTHSSRSRVVRGDLLAGEHGLEVRAAVEQTSAEPAHLDEAPAKSWREGASA